MRNVKLTNKNRLSTLYPELCEEWDYERNFPLRPENVSYGSNKKVGWIDKKGHRWLASINSRAYGGYGCPYCSGHKACIDNCLTTLNPKLAAEWHPTKNGKLTPWDVTPYSHKKVWWIDQNGHEWDATINERSSGNGCPYCSGRRAGKDNCLATTNPYLVEEWDWEKNGKLTPYNVTAGSNKKVAWKCIPKKHRWYAQVYERSGKHGTGCPYCAGKISSPENCLEIGNPKLAKEWHPTKNGKLTPRDVMPNSDKEVCWLCPKKHVYWAKISNRNNNESDCPYCSGNKVCIDNCLATVNPKLAKEWNYKKNGKLTPYDVTSCSSKKVGWIDRYGHEWFATVANRNFSGHGCPKCNKIELNDGTFFDSSVEAYLYLKLKARGFEIRQNVKYGLRELRCDFYLPEINTYIEVTSFHKNMTGNHRNIWGKYYKTIIEKQKYTVNILMAKFRFIQYKMNPRQRHRIIKNLK